MPTARKLPSGKWFIQIRRKGFPSVPISRPTKVECEKVARTIEHQMDLGSHHFMPPKTGELLLRHAFDRYFNGSQFNDKRATTKKAEVGKAVPILKHLGSYSLQNLSEGRIAKYRDDRMLEKTRYGRLPSPNTIRLELALLAAVFKVARREWGIKLDSPLHHVSRPNCQERRRDRRLEPHEEFHLLTLLQAQPNRRLYFMLALILHCCVRPGEAAGLKKANIDIARRRILLPRSDTKTKQARFAILTPPALEIVGLALESSPKESPYLIGTRTKSGGWRPFDYSCSWRKTTEQLALIGVHVPNLRVHDLRHEAISRLVEDTNLTDAQVTAVTGHVDATTMWSYRHLRSDALLKLMDGQVQSTVARYKLEDIYPESKMVELDDDDEGERIAELLGIGESRPLAKREKLEMLQDEIDALSEISRGRKLSAIEGEKLDYLIRTKKRGAG